MASGSNGAERSGRVAGSNGDQTDDEATPLLAGQPGSLTHSVRPISITGQNGRTSAVHDEDEIEPNDFDLLLSKSVSYSCGPVLEPESMENSMLRGSRRYSSAHPRPRSPSKRRLSVSSVGAVAEETPLLSEADASTPLPPESKSFFLNDVSTARFWLIFGSILATYFIVCFDGTIMASSHPVITSYFKSSNSASWLSTAFLLTSTAFQPLLGRLSDTIGRKPPYVVTTAIFLGATIWCALAGSMTSFILARAVCGLGAGGMMTLGSIIISDLVPIEVRGSYQSYINVVYGVGSALGAALGGAMADHLGWRWEFGVQVPPLVFCVAIAIIAVPKDLGLQGKKESILEALKAFDFRGSILLTTSIVFLVLGLNLGGNILPWSHPIVVASLTIFAVGFPAFLYVESYVDRPIMPLYLIWESPRASLIFTNTIAAFITNAIIFNVPLFFQAVLLTSATDSGLRLVIPSIVSSAAGTFTGFAITYTRRLKWAPMWGSALFFAGTVLLTLLQRDWPSWVYLLCLVPHSIGQGFQFPGTFMAILAVSDQSEQAVVTSTLILWRSLGMVLGVAVSSLVVQNGLVHYLEMYVHGPDKEEVITKVRESVEAIAKLSPEYRDQAVMSYEAALRLSFIFCSVLALASVLLVIPIKLPRLGHRK